MPPVPGDATLPDGGGGTPAPSTARMAAWASELAPLRSPGFFAALKGLAGALRQVAAMHDQGRGTGPALLPLLEPILADRYDLLWRADRDIWRPRLFFFREKLRLVLEFRHTILRVAWQEDAADGEGRSFAYDSAGVAPGPDGRDMLAEAARLHAKAVAGGLRRIERFRFVSNNMRVFDSLATTAKLGLLAEALPDFRFHTLEIDAGRALVDPRRFPLGALFAEASLAGKDGTAKAAAPEHIIVSALYLQGGMRNHLRKGLDRLFQAEREAPRPADAPFTLAISLDFEKRAWVEQAEAVSLVLALLLAHHPRVELMSSGMTAAALEPERDRFADIAEQEGRAIEAMLAPLPAPVVVHRLHGQTIPQKARALARASYFLGPVGSASLLPLALGLPGVMFGGVDAVRAVNWMIEPGDRLRAFPPEHVRYVEAVLGARSYAWVTGWAASSYSIRPEIFRDHVAADLARLGLLPGAP